MYSFNVRSQYDARAVAESQIRLAARLLKELDEGLKNTSSDSYEAQEFRAAKFDLLRHKEKAEIDLMFLPPRLTDADSHRRKILNDITEADQVASKERFVDHLKSIGDFRQAKIHLLAILDLRKTIEAETA